MRNIQWIRSSRYFVTIYFRSPGSSRVWINYLVCVVQLRENSDWWKNLKENSEWKVIEKICKIKVFEQNRPWISAEFRALLESCQGVSPKLKNVSWKILENCTISRWFGNNSSNQHLCSDSITKVYFHCRLAHRRVEWCHQSTMAMEFWTMKSPTLRLWLERWPMSSWRWWSVWA